MPKTVRHTAKTNRTPAKTKRTRVSPAKRHHHRVFGLRWHHFSAAGVALLAFVFGVVTLVSQPVQTGKALPALPAGKQWNMIWGDDFNGGGVDTSKWNVQSNSNYGSSNHEDECYEAGNVSEGGGILNLTARRQTVNCGGTNPDTGNSTYYFTSGMITTRAQGGPMKFKFRQGYIEARIRAPKGNPYWPAFWLVGPGDGSTPGWPDYGEFDISEIYGSRPDATFGTMHYACTSGACQTAANVYNIRANSAYGGTSNYGTQMNDASTFASYSGGTTDFNTYGLLWEGNKITWYVNGRPVRYFDGTQVRRYEANGSTTLENSVCTGAMACPTTSMATVFGYDHSINFNLALGGNGPTYSTMGYTGRDSASGYSDGNLVANIPDSMQIDYVHVYQTGDIPAPPPTTPPSNPTPAPPSGGGTTSPTSPSGPSNGGSSNTPPSGLSGLGSGAASSTPMPVSGTLTAPAGTSLVLDGKPVDGTKIDTKNLTNGTHTITYTENGQTKTQTIAVHNPWPQAAINQLKAHKVAYSVSGISVVVLLALIWFGRIYIIGLLEHLRTKGYVHFGGGSVVSPRRK